MNYQFNELVFLYALLTREEDCKKFCLVFHEDWFEKAEHGAVFQEIRFLLRKLNIAPDLRTVRESFINKDVIKYNARIKEVLDEIEEYDKDPSQSQVAYVIQRAHDVATARAVKQLTVDIAFQKAIEEADGPEVLKQLNGILKRFDSNSERKTMNIREAIEALVQSDGFTPISQRIPTGIEVIDQWCGGGLRPKQLGIIVGVTGHGKSAMLLNIADRMSRIEDKRVWFITNELSLSEVTERMLARLSGVDLGDIIDAPAMGLGKLARQWAMNKLEKKVYITDYFRPPISTVDIEDEMIRNRNIYGFWPDVIILDFMERMKPEPGRGRPKVENEWSNMQFIAQDLISLAKRHELVIWTAVQTNRGGISAEEIDLTHIQSSTRHIQEATACIAIRQRKVVHPNKNIVGIQLFNLKQRQSKLDKESVILEADLSKMNITNTRATVLATASANVQGPATPSGPPTVSQAKALTGMTPQQRKQHQGGFQKKTKK